MVSNRHDDTKSLNVRLLDQTQVANGQFFVFREALYQENLARLQAKGKDPISVHMNWNTHVVLRTDGAKKKHIYYLDDDGNCKLSRRKPRQ